MFRLDDMNHARFFFRSNQIEHIPEIEANIRRLMASFVAEGGGNGIRGCIQFGDRYYPAGCSKVRFQLKAEAGFDAASDDAIGERRRQ